MWKRSLLAAMCLSALTATLAQQIDATIYAKIFQVNQPCWTKMAEMLKASVPEGKVLGVGDGPGEPTKTMATVMPKHHFILTDNQEPMIEKAKKRLEGLSNVEFKVMPAEEFSGIDDESVDAVSGCFVLMFVDVKQTFDEVYRVLKPGGHAFFAVWTAIDFVTVPRKAIDALWEKKGWGTAPTFVLNPLSMSPTRVVDPWKGTVEAEVDNVAGLTIHSKETITYPLDIGTMGDTCDATTLLTSSFLTEEFAKEKGMTFAELKADYCKIVSEIMSERSDWKKEDGSYRLGDGTPTIYHLYKFDGNVREL